MSVFVYLAGHAELDQDAAFDEMDGILEDSLRGVALLQDSTVVNGFGQWVIGRPDD